MCSIGFFFDNIYYDSVVVVVVATAVGIYVYDGGLDSGCFGDIFGGDIFGFEFFFNKIILKQ